MVTLWYSGQLSGREEQVEEEGERKGVATARVHSALTGICMDWERIIIKLFFLGRKLDPAKYQHLTGDCLYVL